MPRSSFFKTDVLLFFFLSFDCAMRQVGLSFLTGIKPFAPGFGSRGSQPLDHEGSPPEAA